MFSMTSSLFGCTLRRDALRLPTLRLLTPRWGLPHPRLVFSVSTW